MLTTSPLTLLPIGYFVGAACHGFCASCFRPRLMRSRTRIEIEDLDFDRLIDLEHFARDAGCGPSDMSVMWSRPSMPPRSMNAPNSVMFLTTPRRTSPRWMLPSRSFFILSRSSSSIFLRESTMLRRSSSILMILHSRSRPIQSPGSPTRRTSIWLRRQEHMHADVDQQAALDLAHRLALDHVADLVGLHDAFPAADAVGLLLREHDEPRRVLDLVEVHFQFDARLDFVEAGFELRLSE